MITLQTDVQKPQQVHSEVHLLPCKTVLTDYLDWVSQNAMRSILLELSHDIYWGNHSIPPKVVQILIEWPYTIRRLSRLLGTLAEGF